MDKRNDKIVLGALVVLLLLGGAIMLWRPWETTPRPDLNADTDLAQESLRPETPAKEPARATNWNPAERPPEPPPKQPLPHKQPSVENPPANPPPAEQPPVEQPKPPEAEPAVETTPPKVPVLFRPPKGADKHFRGKVKPEDVAFTGELTAPRMDRPSSLPEPFYGSEEIRFVLQGTVVDDRGEGLPGWKIVVQMDVRGTPPPKEVHSYFPGPGFSFAMGYSVQGGHFRIDGYQDVVKGWVYNVHLRALREDFPSPPAIELEIAPGAEIKDIRIVVHDAATVRFRALNEHGSPLRNTLIRAQLHDGNKRHHQLTSYSGDGPSGTTDSDGFVTMSPLSCDTTYWLTTLSGTPEAFYFTDGPVRFEAPKDGNPANAGEIKFAEGFYVRFDLSRDDVHHMPSRLVFVDEYSREETAAHLFALGIGHYVAYARGVPGNSYIVLISSDEGLGPVEVMRGKAVVRWHLPAFDLPEKK